MYAIVEIGGGQYRVASGDLVTVNQLNTPEGEKIDFDSVLFIRDKDRIEFGSPYVADASVSATVERNKRMPKIVVAKYKRRKGYHRKFGHRQDVSVIRIDSIKV